MTKQYICNRCDRPIDMEVGADGRQVFVPVRWRPTEANSSTTVYLDAYLAEAAGPVRQHFCKACLVVLLQDEERRVWEKKKESRG